jgi:hypothetical protein
LANHRGILGGKAGKTLAGGSLKGKWNFRGESGHIRMEFLETLSAE